MALLLTLTGGETRYAKFDSGATHINQAVDSEGVSKWQVETVINVWASVEDATQSTAAAGGFINPINVFHYCYFCEELPTNTQIEQDAYTSFKNLIDATYETAE